MSELRGSRTCDLPLSAVPAQWIKDLCRKGGFSDPTFYKWRAKYGGMDVPDARRLRELEAENNKLKKLLVEAHLDIHALNTAFGVKR